MLVILTAITLGACGPQPETAPPATASVLPSASPTTTVDKGVSDAITFRQEAGLRADPDWVRQVADDPASAEGVRQLGVPLMPDELETVIAAASRDPNVMANVQAYRYDHPEAWGGAYVDPGRGRIIVLIVGDVDAHRAALFEVISPDAVLEVVPARWPLAELEALQDRIVAGIDWLAEQGADLTGVGVNLQENMVQLDVSSARANIPALAIEHFDADGMLRVVSDGTGVDQMPRGDLAGAAVDLLGNPVPGLILELRGDIARSGPRGDIGLGTGQDGRFKVTDITATGYDIRLFRDTGPDGQDLARGDWILVGFSRALVYPGETTEVTIVVPSAP